MLVVGRGFRVFRLFQKGICRFSCGELGISDYLESVLRMGINTELAGLPWEKKRLFTVLGEMDGKR